MLKFYVLFMVLLIGYVTDGRGEEVSTPEIPMDDNYITTNIQWESRYVSEGRDNLDKAGIQTTTVDISQGFFNLAIWNGWGYDSGYDELQITPALTHEWNDFEMYLYYNYKYFMKDDRSENEFGSGIFYNDLPYHIFTGLDWYYSFENNGSFFRFMLGSRLRPVEKFELEPTIVVGINESYIADGHEGVNHVSFQLNGGYEITSRISILGYLRYNIAVDPDPVKFAGDGLLNDFFWVGVGIEAAF